MRAARMYRRAAGRWLFGLMATLILLAVLVSCGGSTQPAVGTESSGDTYVPAVSDAASAEDTEDMPESTAAVDSAASDESAPIPDSEPVKPDGTVPTETEPVGTMAEDTETKPVTESEGSEPEITQPEAAESVPETLPSESDGEVTLPEVTPPESEPAESEFEVVTLAPETVPEPETGAAEMPRLDIITEGGVAIPPKPTTAGAENPYTRVTVTLSNCHENYAFSDVSANIRVRGNSTAHAPKKPYRLKFDVKQEMLGLAGNRAFKNWCLMADYYDGSMLRTWGTFRFAKALMENKYYSSDCTHVEVYLNGEYQGVYLLCEQTQIHKYRINIPEMVEGDTSVEQGYLLVGVGGQTDEPGLVSVHPGITVRDRNGDTRKFDTVNFTLSGGDYTEAQKQYVSTYVSAVFKVVAKAVYDHEYYKLDRDGTMTRIKTFEWAKTDEEKQIETISRVFNLESAVSMCILDELVKNLDAMAFNMYVDLSPEGDGVLTLAAPWDFDFSMANTHYGTTHSATGFYATNLSYSEGTRINLWYVMLGSIDWFEAMVKEHWQENYMELQAVVSDMISVNYAYDAAFNRDFERWGLPANRNLIHHHDTNDLATFDEHIKAGEFVTNWLQKRLIWLNRQWGDGVNDPPAEEAPELQLTFGTDADMSLIAGIKRCEVALTNHGLKLMPDAEARDPYFRFDYDLLGEAYDAEIYHYLEFTYRIPTGASADTFTTELFLCAGNVSNPTGGISTHVETVADGQWHTVRIDLLETGYWEGTIHEIRFDFFGACAVGDTMYLRDFKLLTK